MMDFTICLPTYNERDNIKTLIPDILAIFDKNELNGSILVIDDNSPDRTADIVQSWCEKDPRVHLLLRKNKEGLGKAYVAGFKHAIKQTPNYIFEMDADYSHEPAVIPIMLDKIKKNKCHLVVGSRKVKGGSTENWGIHRKIISSGANIYTRLLLRLKIHDVTSGFRCIHTEKVIHRLKLDDLDAGGYAFQIELAYLIEKHLKGEVAEVPIKFIDRTYGKSKLGAKDIFEFWLMILKLFLFGWRRKSKILPIK